MTIEDDWAELTGSLAGAGARMSELTAGLGPVEAADGHRALLRALNNQLGRLEVDRERPELVPFNGWREKFFMDNPDFRYWVADVRHDRRYRISGTLGDAVFQSITAYATRGGPARSVGRIDSDSIGVDDDGRFTVVASSEPPESGDWLPLPEGADTIWVRHFHADVDRDRLGDATIEPLDEPHEPPTLDPEALGRRIRRLARTMAAVPEVIAAATADERDRPNELRHWTEMAGGAAFTEPDITYVRGSWSLGPDEALAIEGDVVASRYWNVLLYSRFLNSLDQRHRSVSRTSATATIVDGRYRFVVAPRDPGGAGDWLDTEGRPFGLVVMRWLQPQGEVPLPRVHRCPIGDLERRP